MPEALAALSARITLLQELVHDLRQQAAGSAGAGGRQAVLTSLLLSDAPQRAAAVPWQQQLTAQRQELRVIVGKGTHSRNGEACLPRAVEAYLQEHKHRYLPRGGAIGVLLKLL